MLSSPWALSLGQKKLGRAAAVGQSSDTIVSHACFWISGSRTVHLHISIHSLQLTIDSIPRKTKHSPKHTIQAPRPGARKLSSPIHFAHSHFTNNKLTVLTTLQGIPNSRFANQANHGHARFLARCPATSSPPPCSILLRVYSPVHNEHIL